MIWPLPMKYIIAINWHVGLSLTFAFSRGLIKGVLQVTHNLTNRTNIKAWPFWSLYFKIMFIYFNNDINNVKASTNRRKTRTYNELNKSSGTRLICQRMDQFVSSEIRSWSKTGDRCPSQLKFHQIKNYILTYNIVKQIFPIFSMNVYSFRIVWAN